MVGHVTVSDEVDPVNVMLMKGQAPVPRGNCDEHVVLTPTREYHELSPTKKHPKKSGQDQGDCTHIYLYDGTECAVSNHCSKVTCRSPEDSRQVLTLQMNVCSKPLTVTVTYTIESSSPPIVWSHTFEDGEKAGLPVPPGVGGNGKVNLFLKAELKEKNAKIQFKVTLSLTELLDCNYFQLFKGGWFVCQFDYSTPPSFVSNNLASLPPDGILKYHVKTVMFI